MRGKINAKKFNKTIASQNEKTKKAIIEQRKEIIEAIDEANDALIVITDKNTLIIGGYVQTKAAIVQTFANFIRNKAFDANTLRRMVDLAEEVSTPEGLMAKFLESAMKCQPEELSEFMKGVKARNEREQNLKR